MYNEYVYVVSLDWDDVRKLCIEKQFYTRGTAEEYENMLKSCQKYGLKPVDVVLIAEDIVNHTNPENEWIKDYEPLDEVVCYLSGLLNTEVMSYVAVPDTVSVAEPSERPAKPVRRSAKAKIGTEYPRERWYKGY